NGASTKNQEFKCTSRHPVIASIQNRCAGRIINNKFKDIGGWGVRFRLIRMPSPSFKLNQEQLAFPS
ncbi:MAG: hypothetical protein M0006_05395, partial [Magnetospirillum sp.]|nr:hypothetical protein [Magnetospirillum sp.]